MTTASGGVRTDGARNVVIVVLDSVRKDAFDLFAHRLRARADVSFEGCRAASSWSTPSHASMVTGELPHRHGVHTHQRSFAGIDRSETFLGELADRGYETAGVTANFYAGSAFDFDALFDEFVDVNPDQRYPGAWADLDADGPRMYAEAVGEALRSGAPGQFLANGLAALLRDRFDDLPIPSPYDGGAVPTCRAVRQRVEAATEPLCLFVNFMDAHQPLFPHVGLDASLHGVANDWSSREGFYDAKWDVTARDDADRHREFLSNYRALYAATVEYLDRRVSALVDRVDRLTDRETTYVVTSDHGENLAFEADGAFEHTGTLSEAALHVPLSVLNAPSGYPAAVEGYVSQLRLGDLVVALAAGGSVDVTADRIPAEVAGLSPGSTGLSGPEEAALDRMRRAVYDGSHKTVWDSEGRVDRYRLDPDRPCWQTRVGEGTVPAWADQFFDSDIEASAAATAAVGSQSTDLDEDAMARLEDLGYR